MKSYQPTLTTIFATNHGMEGVAVFMALVGFAIKYWIGRRRFKRRVITGLEAFKSYEQMKLVTSIEWLGSLIGNILIIIGAILFLFFMMTPNLSHK